MRSLASDSVALNGRQNSIGHPGIRGGIPVNTAESSGGSGRESDVLKSELSIGISDIQLSP